MKPRARDIPLDVTLLEATGRVGGVIRTEHRDGFLLEHGPDAFSLNKTGSKKCFVKNSGLRINSSERIQNAVRVLYFDMENCIPFLKVFYLMAPGAFKPFLKSSLFSWHGKLRMAMELFHSAPGQRYR